MVGSLLHRVVKITAAAGSLALWAAPSIATSAETQASYVKASMSQALHSPDGTLVSYYSNCPGCQNQCPCPGTYGSQQPGGMADSGAGAGQGGQGMDFEPGAFGGLASDSWAVNDSIAGYIDNPIVGNWFRARYDVAVNNPNPDLAEFFYAKYGNNGGAGPVSPINTSPHSANYQVGSFYFEVQLAPRLSAFAELQIQRTDIFFSDQGTGESIVIKNGGLGDTMAGLKWAMYVDEDQYLTFQVKTYAPSGDASRGLGTDHVSIEPGFLYLRRLSDRSYFQGEVRDFIPIGGSDYAGNVIRYGGGLGYDIFGDSGYLNPYTADGWRLTAVAEVVGWTVFNGFFTPPDVVGQNATPVEADGFTVVNVKPGFRLTHNQGSFYAGAGIAITGDQWYSNLFRLEYRRAF